jgi:hypothetical protein
MPDFARTIEGWRELLADGRAGPASGAIVVNGLFRRRPAKPYYEATQGVGLLWYLRSWNPTPCRDDGNTPSRNIE